MKQYISEKTKRENGLKPTDSTFLTSTQLTTVTHVLCECQKRNIETWSHTTGGC